MIAASDNLPFIQSFHTTPVSLVRYMKHPPGNLK